MSVRHIPFFYCKDDTLDVICKGGTPKRLSLQSASNMGPTQVPPRISLCVFCPEHALQKPKPCHYNTNDNHSIGMQAVLSDFFPPFLPFLRIIAISFKFSSQVPYMRRTVHVIRSRQLHPHILRYMPLGL